MPKTRDLIWVRVVLIAVFVVAVSATLYLTDRLRVATINAFTGFNAKPELVLYNSEYELLLFDRALHDFENGDISDQQMLFRFEILFSRLFVIEDSSFFREATAGGAKDLIAAATGLRTLLDQFDIDVQDGVDPEDVARAQARIMDLRPMMRTAINEIVSLESTQNRALFAQVETSRERAVLALVTALVSFLLLSALLLYQITTSRKSARNIRQLYEIADEAVDQLRTELELRTQAEKANQELRGAVEQSNDVIIIADEDGQILFSNTQEALGGQLSVVTGVAFDTGILNRLDIGETLTLPSVNDAATNTYGYLQPDGERLWLEWSVTQVRTQNDAPRYLAIARNVTRERKANEQMARVQKVETMGIMAGGLAHDFNNVLATIVGSAHLAHADAKEADQSEIAEELDQIIHAAGRASELVSGLLNLGRDDAADADLARWGDVVKQVKGLVNAMHAASIEVLFSDRNADCRLQISTSNLHQVIFNIVKNSMDAIGPNGGRITVTLDTQGSWAEITVRDTGPGIPPGLQRRIFEPFYSTKTTGKGSGLGLSIVRSLVMDANGEIHLDSTPDQGTSFVIKLPVSRTELRRPSVQDPQSAEGAHVLLVDDEPDVLRVTRRLIEKAGYEVAGFVDPFDANEYFVDNLDRISVVVSDVIMPGMTGPTMVEDMRAHDPDIGVIFVSAYTNVEIGLDDNTLFLQKPANPDQLLHAIASLSRPVVKAAQ